MAVRETRRTFTVDEYYRMAGAGILSEDDRVELIEGEIIEMSPIGSRHAACVMRLIALLTQQVGDAAIVNVQNPVRLSHLSEPEPGVSLLRPRADFYSEEHPKPQDVLLIVEVSDTSLEYDREVKVPLYAQAGIPEVWVVDLLDEKLHAYSRSTDGSYRDISSVGHGGSIASQTLPGLVLSIDDVLG